MKYHDMNAFVGFVISGQIVLLGEAGGTAIALKVQDNLSEGDNPYVTFDPPIVIFREEATDIIESHPATALLILAPFVVGADTASPKYTEEFDYPESW